MSSVKQEIDICSNIPVGEYPVKFERYKQDEYSEEGKWVNKSGSTMNDTLTYVFYDVICCSFALTFCFLLLRPLSSMQSCLRIHRSSQSVVFPGRGLIAINLAVRMIFVYCYMAWPALVGKMHQWLFPRSRRAWIGKKTKIYWV